MQHLHQLEDYKRQAKTLRAQLGADELSHAEALELVAKQHGFRNWNTLHGSIGNSPAVRQFIPGERVQGTYLGHAFEGVIRAARKWGSEGHTHITIRFDEAVDVVAFDSFSAFRQQVSAVIDQTGKSPRTTSDGRPHMMVTN